MNSLNISKFVSAYKKLFIFLVSCVISLNLFSKNELIDRVIAVVDSGVIMVSQLNS